MPIGLSRSPWGERAEPYHGFLVGKVNMRKFSAKSGNGRSYGFPAYGRMR